MPQFSIRFLLLETLWIAVLFWLVRITPTEVAGNRISRDGLIGSIIIGCLIGFFVALTKALQGNYESAKRLGWIIIGFILPAILVWAIHGFYSPM